MLYDFTDDFDRQLAHQGPAAVFTLNHEGFLALDPMRSRDFYNQNPGPYPLQWCHCVVIDQATSWPQYMLITSPALATQHLRATIQFVADQQTAAAKIQHHKQLVYAASIEKVNERNQR